MKDRHFKGNTLVNLHGCLEGFYPYNMLNLSLAQSATGIVSTGSGNHTIQHFYGIKEVSVI